MKKLLLALSLVAATTCFADTDSTTVKQKQSGNHTLFIIPGAITSVESVHSSVGLGLAYEFRLPQMPNVIVSIPLMLNFSDGGEFYPYDASSLYGGLQYRSLSTMPGVKLLLGKSSNKVRYGVGGSFFYEYGKKPNIYPVISGQFDPFGSYYSVYGALINNSLNIYPSKHLSICFNTGIGMSYNKVRTNSFNFPFPWTDNQIMQFTVAFGYRF